MSHSIPTIERYLKNKGLPSSVVELTPDASTREYFRISWNGGTAIACFYPEQKVDPDHPYIDITSLFSSAGLPVAEIFDVDRELGIIVTEDFGDTLLRDTLEFAEASEKEHRIDEAIDLIARIQATTSLAYETNSVASRLKFDVEKLTWELTFFATHYFETLCNRELPFTARSRLSQEFHDLSSHLEQRASVLCHRDFHAANLMIGPDGHLKIIDHQDARIGTVSYDLVSLLLDRITALPSDEWLAEKRGRLAVARTTHGLPLLEASEFQQEFDLQTIQRCLKAAGTFSYQAAVRGKTHFIKFIGPMFKAALNAAERLERFDELRAILSAEIIDRDS